MSDIAPPPEAQPADPKPYELPVPYAAFAATLKPRAVPMLRNGRPVVFKGRVVMTATPGQPDEIWLRLLKIRNGGERHTVTEWRALVDGFREQPAYPGQRGAI